MSEDNQDQPMILEQIDEMKKKTRKTGENQSIKVDKRQFIEEVPKAGQDPRMAFTKNKFIFSTEKYTKMSIGELRDLCLKTKGHPFSLQKAREVEGLSDRVPVILYTQDVNRLKRLSQ